jgi:hypothetical protein
LLRDPRLPFAILTASLLLFQLQELWAHAYREFPPGELGATVRSGPWKGIRTTPRKIEFLARLAADLARVRDGAESILFYDYFPAGYLMTDLEPRTPGLWLFPDSPLHQGNAGLRRVYAERLRSDGRRPDLVVRLRCIPTRPPMRLQYPQHDPVSELFEPPDYETVVQRGCYSVARRLDAPRRRGSPWPPIPGSNPRARPPG